MTVSKGPAAITKTAPGQKVSHTTNLALTNGTVIAEDREEWDQRPEALRVYVDWGNSTGKQWHKASLLTVTG
jgi:hypothetical protein